MRNILFGGVLAVLIVSMQIAIVGQPKESSSLSGLEFRQAPDFELTDINGEGVHLSDFQGRVVMLQFWAQWCTSCEGDLRVFQEIHENNLEKTPEMCDRRRKYPYISAKRHRFELRLLHQLV